MQNPKALSQLSPVLSQNRCLQRLRTTGYGVLAFGSVLLVWWLAAHLFNVPRFLLPAPRTVWEAGRELVVDGQLAHHIGTSLYRLLLGYAGAILLAIPIAFLLTRFRILRALCHPLLEFLRQVPPLAMMPLLILWLGIGEAQKIGIITLACFFPLFIGTLGGIAQCDVRLIEVGRVARLREREILRRIVLPAAIPSIAIGLRIALGQGWRALVGAELIASAAGLGYMIIDAQDLARTDIVIVGILVIGTLGVISDWLACRLIKHLAPWVRLEGEHA